MEGMTILELIFGGSLISFLTSFLTFKYVRRKAKGEAHSAEYEGMKVEQDTYQELIGDLKTAWKEQKEYIGELKSDRHHLREERNELWERLDKTEGTIRQQQRDIARLGSRIDSLTPLICTVVDCQKRQRKIIGMVSDDSFDVTSEQKQEVEPLEMEDV